MGDSLMEQLSDRVNELVEEASWSPIDYPPRAKGAWEAYVDGTRLLVIAWVHGDVEGADGTVTFSDIAERPGALIMRMTPEQSKRASQRAQEQE